VSLDPATVPSKFVAPDGQIDFLIEAHDPASGTAAFHTVSARRVSNVLDDLTDLLRADAPIPTGWIALPGLPAKEAPASPSAAAAPTLGGTDAGSDNLEADMNTSTIIPDTGELLGIRSS
jgi:hypothetical protein